MSMLKEERKALRDELERIYGIHLREDDELLPILQFITEASKLTDLNVSELKALLEQMKASSEAAFGKYTHDYGQFLKASRELYASALNQSREILVKTRQDLEGLPGIFLGFRQSIEQLKIPTHITVKRISFEENTMSFLWKFFVASVAVVSVTIVVAALWISMVNDELHQLRRDHDIQQQQWLQKFYNKMKEENPEATERFIMNNPIPNKTN